MRKEQYKTSDNDAKTAATEQKWSKRFMLFMTGFWSLVASVFLWATFSRELCAADTCGQNFLCIVLADGGGYRCECITGFEQDGAECRDVDECSESPCVTGATCTNIPHSFRCRCKTGFLDVNGDASDCRDIDECHHGEVCPDMASCVNTPGSYLCPCQTGFVLDNGACVDNDECSTGTQECDANAACSNSLGSYACTCNEPQWNGNGRDCYYFDPCWNGPCGDYSKCEVDFESPGRYRCPCQTPFVNDGTSHGTCHCPDGYANMNAECVDMNECDSTNECSPFSMCKNTIGSYQCKCLSGFVGNGKQCDDLDECSYRVHNCNEQSVCSNYDGYYECTCREGFIGDGYRRWGCKDKDECIMKSHDCDKISESCFNTVGSYICRCKAPNFISYNGACVDRNECVTDPCPFGYNCVNKNNGFDCVCALGYRKLNKTCHDIDECDENKNNCDRHSMCLNKQGGHDCICKSGFVKNERNKCVDDNECLYGICTGKDVLCKNTIGSYECACNAGYIYRKWSDIQDTKYNHQYSSYRKSAAKIFREAGCIDFDECQDEDLGDEAVCKSEREFCWNTDGSHSCQCMQGWQRVGDECVDVNQCKLDDPCPDETVCHNTDGYPGYECLCPDGYAEEFKVDKYRSSNSEDKMYVVCHDIDECSLNSHICSEDRECQNTAGSYSCVCTTGYATSGLECFDIDECEQYGQCDPGYKCKNTVGSFVCLCGDGYVMNQQYGHCVDLDECKLKLHDCKTSEICVDSLGSYVCRCAAGYVDNGLNTCVDNNECMSDTHQCDERARCSNTEGSHECQCLGGYIGNGTVCVDDNECDSGDHDCSPHADCLNRDPSEGQKGWECRCKPGFETEGDECTDFNECREDCWPDSSAYETAEFNR